MKTIANLKTINAAVRAADRAKATLAAANARAAELRKEADAILDAAAKERTDRERDAALARARKTA